MRTAKYFRKAIFLVGLLGLAASFSLAVYGFSLANHYDDRVEFSLINPGLNPFRPMAILYSALSVLFFFYIISSKLRSGCQLLVSIPLVSLMVFYELRLISVSGVISPSWPEYAFSTLLLDKGGALFLAFSILLFMLSVGSWSLTKARKDMP